VPRMATLFTAIIAFGFAAPIANANLVINAIYTADISPEARAVIANANKFYTDNFLGNVTVTIGYGSQPGGGATAGFGVSSIVRSAMTPI
jgi:hypothetical protein